MPSFDRPGLAANGFAGWQMVTELRADPSPIPLGPGVYVVLRDGPVPAVLDTSVGGWFKARDPSVDRADLETRLRDDTPVLYIGKGDALRRRLVSLFRFGAGRPTGHWGGRYLWQLEGAEEVLVAWREDEDPLGAEAELLTGYSRQFGSLPFANLRY
jgi:hypothetical protein